MTQIIYPIWRQRLARSLHINRSQMHSKYYQVASVDPSARPKNRTMVFRGFLQGTQNLLSVTDLRSEKISEWQGDGKLHFEICWYFTGSREQYRVAGEVALISNSLKSSYQEFGEQTKTSLIKQQWSNLSDKAREPFYSSSPKAPFDDSSALPSPQDKPVTSVNDTNEVDSNSNAASNITSSVVSNNVDISDNFCVIVFTPHTVDYLNLKSKPQQRCLYDIQDGWKERMVNP